MPFCSADVGPKSVHSKLDGLLNQGLRSLYYAIPAIIYLVYNMLQFVNFQFFDAATYRVLINMRVIITGLLMQVTNLVVPLLRLQHASRLYSIRNLV
jgi:hypothetical protein